MGKNLSLKVETGNGVRKDHLPDDLESIRKEILTEDLNEKAKQWINEWMTDEGNNGVDQGKKAEISDFVKSSLRELDAAPQENQEICLSDPKKLRRLIINFSSTAAAIFLSIILLRPFTDQSDPEYLFESYYKPFNAVSTFTRGADPVIVNMISEAVDCYKKQNYTEAASRFMEALDLNPTSNLALFFLGMAKLGSGDVNGSIEPLQKIMNGKGEFSSEATWYLGLAYLKSGSLEQARDCFAALSLEPGYYSREAELILRRLR